MPSLHPPVLTRCNAVLCLGDVMSRQALHVAAEMGYTECVDLLLRQEGQQPRQGTRTSSPHPPCSQRRTGI